jgi:hypothetical protein
MKQQYAWLVENGFIQRVHSLVWIKSYETFNIELWRSNTGAWELSIVDWADDIPLFSLPDDLDFNKLTTLITLFDSLQHDTATMANR